jgi:CheY-like chemotaxis protein
MAEDLPDLTMAQAQNLAETMSKSANNLYTLIENLLDWAQIQQGAISFNPEVIQLNTVVGESMAPIREPAKNKGVEIETDIAGGLEVLADKNMLQTVIRNLVSNAVKFTRKGGTVSIAAKSAGDKTVEISIRDNGIGMSREMVGNLFRIDVKTGRKGTDGEPSTGLGLLLCKEFIEKNGGKIWVESAEGEGSTFYFTLPIYAPSESESNNGNEILNTEKNVQTSPETSGLKILIAEDDETSGELISIHIRKLGNEIITVQTGTEALETCRDNPDIDMILMDIQMPEMSGYEATRQIRQFNTDVIIIALTAFALTGDREKAIEAGCNDYISKPIKKDELMGLIQKYFSE